MDSIYNNSCLICGNKNLTQYIDLKKQPLANSFHHGEELKTYPLKLNVCNVCWHSQLSVSVDPSELFEHYLYISDTTKTLEDYFKWVTEYVIKDSNINKGKVLEIACNSGLLLEMFKNKGFDSYGVDPAKNLRILSENRQLNVYVNYWDSDTNVKIRNDIGKVNLILAFHVLPHVQNPMEFISLCYDNITDDGKIYIQTSQCDMFLNGEFDVIYHEHTSYFTAYSILELAHRNNLFVNSIIKTNIHGKSFLFSLQKKKCTETQINELIHEELTHNLYNIETYIKFGTNAIKLKTKLTHDLSDYKKNNYVIVGYGAAAKGNTLLNYIEYPIDYIIDDNEMKQGYLTPGMNIPVCSINKLKDESNNICFIPLAWNFYAEIKERIIKVRNITNDVFIKYFPEYIIDTNQIKLNS